MRDDADFPFGLPDEYEPPREPVHDEQWAELLAVGTPREAWGEVLLDLAPARRAEFLDAIRGEQPFWSPSDWEWLWRKTVPPGRWGELIAALSGHPRFLLGSDDDPGESGVDARGWARDEVVLSIRLPAGQAQVLVAQLRRSIARARAGRR